jgi:hypothetical protein
MKPATTKRAEVDRVTALRVGQEVMVDVTGFQHSEINTGVAHLSGTITAMDPNTGSITVQMTTVIGGVYAVTVPPSRITPIGT